jgi:hypothetical protein
MPDAAVPAAQPADSLLQRITEAAGALDDVSNVTPAEAVARFDALHTDLQAALAELDES